MLRRVPLRLFFASNDSRTGCPRKESVIPGRLCQTPMELAIVQAEGSPMGPLMRAINRIADATAPEFPDVAVGTLAYGGTITPPRTVGANLQSLPRSGSSVLRTCVGVWFQACIL